VFKVGIVDEELCRDLGTTNVVAVMMMIAPRLIYHN